MHWSLRVSNALTAMSSSSHRKKTMAMLRLDWQRLSDIRVNPRNGATEFLFNLAARLCTRRFDEDDSDIWTFYSPNGFVLSVKGNGTFTCERGTRRPTRRDQDRSGRPMPYCSPAAGSQTVKACVGGYCTLYLNAGRLSLKKAQNQCFYRLSPIH